MIIKNKEIVELLNKKKEIIKIIGVKASETLDRITAKYQSLKEQEANIQKKIKSEEEKINSNQEYQEAKKNEDKATNLVNEIQEKFNNIIQRDYLGSLKDEEMFGNAKVISNDEIEIEVYSEVEKFKEKFIKNKKDVIKNSVKK